ncbi:MAG: SDR family NAD(P)-dependent oxidoreductase [Alphaproteobacteria bacterium]|nr:short-chain dehydrogenase [Rhodobiaceae bacterium]MBO6543300.1 SDR family NAD(P)-dependent oxidoreductase [Alphaproteobacteria bacterium]MBO6628251.1 SDR family NAD(P)-dependent oxidoreductase [Alphaproteobacteria bacterium]MDF1627276.1 SDR family NAD(P)-dependent oxidoreductase [Parvibaculaceae bacterium]
MENFEGRTAFVTGGGSGIGLSMARSFGQAGMNVVLADIDKVALAAGVEDLKSRQISVVGVECDVASRSSVEAAAQKAIEAFGKVHVVCNNAGVGVGGPIEDVRPRDWDWIIDVNLKGVVYGTEVFVPIMRAQGEGGHFVNTASMAGMVSPAGMEPYNATKFAVVAMSEGWQGQLAGEGIGVSVLCPGFVKTRIHESSRTRQDTYGEAAPREEADLAGAAAFVLNGLEPDRVGARVLEAIRDNELYIFTHPDMRAAVEARFANILAGFDKAAESDALVGSGYVSPAELSSVGLGK